MKRLTTLLSLAMLLLLAAFSTSAQNIGELITLNDAVPAIDVVISLPADTTGAVALEFTQVSVSLTDASGVRVFYAADPRLHALELNIAPNSGSHTLTIQRLSGVTEAYVRVAALPEMTVGGTVERVEGANIALNQEAMLTLDSGAPGGALNVTIPADTTGVVTAKFPGAGATTQLIDATGVVVAESFNGHVDGVNMVLDGGDYTFTILGSDLTNPVVAGARVITTEVGGFTVLEAPTTPVSFTIGAAPTNNTGSCTATVQSSSINLRSGPGTGYTVMGFGYRDEIYLVGGRNPENNWVVVVTPSGETAWVSAGTARLEGVCGDLTVFNIPLRNAQPAAVVVTTAQPNVVTIGGTTSTNTDDHDDNDHDEDEGDDD